MPDYWYYFVEIEDFYPRVMLAEYLMKSFSRHVGLAEMAVATRVMMQMYRTASLVQ